VKLLLSDVANDPLKKAQVTRDIVESIGKIPDGIKRMAFIKECAVLLDMNEGLLITELNKTRNDFLTQKEKEWVPTETPKVSLQDELKELLKEEPIFEQERYMLKMMLLHGHKEKEGFINTAHYILTTMQALELDFEQEAMRLLVDEIKFMLQENLQLSTAAFINHSNPLISASTASILAQQNEASIKWTEKYNVPLISPEDNYLEDIASTLIYLEKRQLEKMSLQATEELKIAIEKGSEEEVNFSLELIKLLKEKQKELSNKAGIVILH
jgi:DNA primase